MQVVDLQATAPVLHDAGAALCDATASRPRTLKEAVRAACAVRRYSPRTFEAYWHWIKLYVHYHGRRPPREMGQTEVGQFLSWLATERKVSASTQSQALAGVLFLYQKVLEMDIGWVEGIARAKKEREMFPSNDANQPSRPAIRVEWNIQGREGHHPWYVDNPQNRAFMEAQVAFGCRRYGPGTHWLAKRKSQNDHE